MVKHCNRCITHNSRLWLALRFSPLLPGSHLSLQESRFLQWCGYFYSSWLVKWEKWREHWLVCHSVVPLRNQWCSLRMLLMCCRAQAGTHIRTRAREGVTAKMCHLLTGWFSLLTSSTTHSAQTHQAYTMIHSKQK